MQLKRRKIHNASIQDEVAHLRDLGLKGLRSRWQSMFRKSAPEHLPRHLVLAILAYQIQAERLGDLDHETMPAETPLLERAANRVVWADWMVETVDIELAAHHPVIEPVSNLSREREFPMQRLSDKIGPFGRCSQAETTPVRDFGAHVAPKLVWDSFGSWLRTIRPGIPPLEFVVGNALRLTLPAPYFPKKRFPREIHR